MTIPSKEQVLAINAIKLGLLYNQKAKENLEGGKFWGEGEWIAMGDCTNGHQAVYQNTYAFWIVVEREYDIVDC